jgi:hypothetical protein
MIIITVINRPISWILFSDDENGNTIDNLIKPLLVTSCNFTSFCLIAFAEEQLSVGIKSIQECATLDDLKLTEEVLTQPSPFCN